MMAFIARMLRPCLGYMVLFTVLCVAGGVVAALTELSGLSQSACRFVFGMVLALFALDNIALLMEINRQAVLLECEVDEKKRLLARAHGKLSIVAKLAETNGMLVQRCITLNKLLKS